MALYDALSRTAEGRRHLAEARLRYRVLTLLHDALERSGMSQSDVAARVGLSKSAASQVFSGNGNLRINTIGAYLDAMGCELKLSLVDAGTARAEATDWLTGPVFQYSLPKGGKRPALDAAPWDADEVDATWSGLLSERIHETVGVC